MDDIWRGVAHRSPDRQRTGPESGNARGNDLGGNRGDSRQAEGTNDADIDTPETERQGQNEPSRQGQNFGKNQGGQGANR